jgi:hypothetical protein
MFYVTILDGPRVSLALGPFKRHEDALGRVARVREFVQARDVRAAFYAFGTSKWTGEGSPPAGKLNGHGLGPSRDAECSRQYPDHGAGFDSRCGCAQCAERAAELEQARHEQRLEEAHFES